MYEMYVVCLMCLIYNFFILIYIKLMIYDMILKVLAGDWRFIILGSAS